MQRNMDIVKGVAIGMAVGTAMGRLTVTNKKKDFKTVAGRAAKAVGEVVESITQVIG